MKLSTPLIHNLAPPDPATLSSGRTAAAEPKLIMKSRSAVPALLLRAGSDRSVVPTLSSQQQLRDDAAAEAHALRQRRDDVVAALGSRRTGPGR